MRNPILMYGGAVLLGASLFAGRVSGWLGILLAVVSVVCWLVEGRQYQKRKLRACLLQQNQAMAPPKREPERTL